MICNISYFIIDYSNLIKFSVHLLYKTDISIKNSFSLCKILKIFPCHLIIVLYLHDLITLSKNTFSQLFFFKSWLGRIQYLLQFLIKIYTSQYAFSYRSKYLYICSGRHILIISGKSGKTQILYSLQHLFFTSPSEKKKIFIFSIAVRIFSSVYSVSIDYYHTFFGLSEYFSQFSTIYIFTVYYIPQHIPCAYRRKLIGITHYYKACPRPYSTYKAIHQHQIYHRSFINNNSIIIERIFFSLSKPHHIFTF